MVELNAAKLVPFSRDRLFTSIHDSCRHRSSHVDDASALTQTIISALMGIQKGGILSRTDITRTAHEVLDRFDQTAATVYAAYHPAASKT
jgi:transcriptional regulator NrdR family protein